MEFKAYHGSDHRIKKFSDEFVGGEEATDQEGPGIYFTTLFSNAERYGKIIYTARLTPRKLISSETENISSRDELIKLAQMAEDWETSASDWSENPYDGIEIAIDSAIEYNDNEKDTFLQIWIDFYRYRPVGYVKNMVKLGYDGVFISKEGEEGDGAHIVVYDPRLIKVTNVEERDKEGDYEDVVIDENKEDDLHKIVGIKKKVGDTAEYDRLGEMRKIIREVISDDIAGYHTSEYKYNIIKSNKGDFVGIEVSKNAKLIASISIGITRNLYDENAVVDDDERKFNKLTYNKPFIHNIGVNEWYQNKGVATSLYKKLFKQLQIEGYDIIYSGITRNKVYVNNIWDKLKDGEVDINGKKVYYKLL